jgi:hypothetical protein
MISKFASLNRFLKVAVLALAISFAEELDFFARIEAEVHSRLHNTIHHSFSL